MMSELSESSNYFRESYVKWYAWFSYVYDYFVKIFCFMLNGGMGGERRWRDKLIDWANPQPGDSIIDICSGTGSLSIRMGRKLSGDGKAVGIEISDAQLKQAVKKEKGANVFFVQADAQDMPFADCFFDQAVICGALHEMPREVRHRVLCAARKVIKQDGRLVLFEHKKPNSRWKALLFDVLERMNPEYITYKDMLASGLTNEIESEGFKILKIEEAFLGFFHIILAEKELTE